MKKPYRMEGSGRRGAALIITLAFMILLSALILIFFSLSMSYKMQSNSNFNDFKSAALAQGALETVVGDMRQEIYNGSTVTTNGSGTNTSYLYIPITNLYAIPQRSGNPAFVNGGDPTPNLIRISVRTETYPSGSPAVSSRASPVSSTNAAYSGQYISLARWNKHYLLPRGTNSAGVYLPGTTNIDTTPTNSFSPPDWVYVTSQGPQVLSTATNTVIGRYAYAIYDEGGLLDANVAGFPSNVATNTAPDPGPSNFVVWGSGLKGPEAFADLTVTNAMTGTNMLTQTQINQIVGWRNNATVQPTGNFSSGYTFSAANAATYHDAVVGATNGFLTTSGLSYTDPATGSLDTDQKFSSRQALIAFVNATNASGVSLPQDCLQYLATFTRDTEQPNYVPPVGRPMVQDSTNSNTSPFGTGNDAYGSDRASPTTNSPTDINPPLLSVRVTTSFTRADGTTAQVGDPLIKERFPLSRLSLFPTNEATPSAATAALIYQYFGLTKQSSGVWYYNHDPNNTAGIDRLETSSGVASVVSQGREPDFFELLKAAINTGSIGKGSAYNESNTSSDNYTTPGSVGYLLQAHDTLTALQILQIGANIIDQYKADNFPTRIQFSGDTSTPPNIVCGSEDLPYLYRLRNWVMIYGTSVSAGTVALLVQPELWDPYSYNWASNSSPGQGFISASSTPSKFRVRLEPDPSVPATGAPINVSVTYTDGTVTSPTNVSENAPNYKSSTSSAPNPVPLTFMAGELNNNWGFREPTLLASPTLCPTAYLITGAPTAFSEKDLNNGTTFTGFPIVTFPWIDTAVDPTDNANKITITPNSEPACLRCYLEYLDPGTSNYVVYDQQVVEYQGGASSIDVHEITNAANDTYALALASDNYDDCGWIRTDPRTSRWGAMYSEYLYSLPTIGNTLAIFGSERADGGISFGSHLGGRNDDGFVGTGSYSKQYRGYQHGYAAENSTRQTYQTDGETGPSANLRYNLDPDGVPRRAMAGYVTDSTNGGTAVSSSQPLTGLPMAIGSPSSTYGSVNNTYAETTATALTPAYGSRPTILHRPFRSVAELGYAFRDTPWGNINFTFPESGDSPLLDVFCINDTSSTGGLVAGRVDLNTRQAPVLAALISGSLEDKDSATPSVLSQAMASQLATQLVARTTSTNVTDTSQGPLMSRADLVGTWMGSTNATTSGSNLKTVDAAYTISPDNFYTGFSHDIGTSLVPSVNGTPTVALIPRQRNAVMRALVDSGTARTWNLLIDLVAQSGRFPPNTTNLANFVVEGEKHYWLHVAIDRYTGQVIDSQLEVVRE